MQVKTSIKETPEENCIEGYDIVIELTPSIDMFYDNNLNIL